VGSFVVGVWRCNMGQEKHAAPNRVKRFSIVCDDRMISVEMVATET